MPLKAVLTDFPMNTRNTTCFCEEKKVVNDEPICKCSINTIIRKIRRVRAWVGFIIHAQLSNTFNKFLDIYYPLKHQQHSHKTFYKNKASRNMRIHARIEIRFREMSVYD